MTQLLPNGKQQFTDNNGKPLVNGKVFHYFVGTNNPKTTYQDADETIPNTNPVILNSRGEASIYGTGNYRQVLQTAAGVTIWDQVVLDAANPALSALDTFKTDLTNTADPAKGDALVGFRAAPTGSVPRTVHSKFEDLPSAKDQGAIADTTTDNAAAIEAAMAAGNVVFPSGNFYSIGSAIRYRSERAINGTFMGFSGTVIKPTGDFPALAGTTLTSNYTRTSFRDLQLNGENNTASFAVTLYDCFVMDFDRVWLRNSYKGIDILRSNSITFKDLKVMETPRSDAINITNCTSLKFIGCNFETSVALQRVGGKFRINSTLGSTSNADLVSCQFERSGIEVGAATITSSGGVLSDCDINLSDESRGCVIDMEMTGSAMVHDLGMANVVHNAYCQNMATPKHEWPPLAQATPSTSLVFGAAGEEWVFMVSAGSKTSAGVTAGTIEIRDGATTLAAVGPFTFPAYGNTVGIPARRSKTLLGVVRNPTGASGPVFTNCAPFDLRGGKNLLTNGTFNGGTTTGWVLGSVTAAPTGDDVLLTPTASNWTILQNIDTVARQGKRYIAVAKFDGPASLTYGNASDGSAGARVCSDSGVPNAQGDGFTVAMISFLHLRGLAANLSLGRIGGTDPVTVKWIALIQVD